MSSSGWAGTNWPGSPGPARRPRSAPRTSAARCWRASMMRWPRAPLLTKAGLAGSAAAGRPGDAGAVGGVVDDAARGTAQYRAEVDHVPPAAPGDQRGDADRAQPAVLPVDQPWAGHMPVADLVVAHAWVDPGGLPCRHDHPDQTGLAGGLPQEAVRGRHVEPEVGQQPAVPVGCRVSDGLHLLVRGQW